MRPSLEGLWGILWLEERTHEIYLIWNPLSMVVNVYMDDIPGVYWLSYNEEKFG